MRHSIYLGVGLLFLTAAAWLASPGPRAARPRKTPEGRIGLTSFALAPTGCKLVIQKKLSLTRNRAKYSGSKSTTTYRPATNDRASGKSALHMVNAWGCEQHLVLAQMATDAKSNEITAALKLLVMLTLKGAIVTADALNCHRAIAQQIVEGRRLRPDVESSQGTPNDDVIQFFDDPASPAATPTPVVEADHRRSLRQR